jgi:Tfp pilus assembly protein PilO
MKHNNIKKHRLTSSHFLIVILLLLMGVQVYFSNKIATTGEQLSYLETKARQLEDENRKMLAENVNIGSLQQLAAKAKELGYVEPKEIVNFASPDSIALNQ